MRDIRANVVQLRPACGADAEAIIRTHFAAVHETASEFYPGEVLNSWSPEPDAARYEQIRRAIAKDDELFVVAEDASGVVGFGSIVTSLQELRAVYVHPRLGRKGVGASILQELERLAVAKQCVHLRMDASVNAEAFYSRHEYEVVSRGVHRLASGHEMACTKMKKVLPQSI